MEDQEETIGMLFNWDPQVVSLFVEQVNLKPEGRPTVPDWLNIVNQSELTNETLLMKGIVDFLVKDIASTEKLFGCTFIGPITMIQYGNICRKIGCIENDRSMQLAMKAILQQNTATRPMYLASLAIIYSKEAAAGAQPLNLASGEEKNIINLFN